MKKKDKPEASHKAESKTQIDGDDATRRDEQHLGHLAMLGEMGASRECIDGVIARYNAECVGRNPSASYSSQKADRLHIIQQRRLLSANYSDEMFNDPDWPAGDPRAYGPETN